MLLPNVLRRRIPTLPSAAADVRVQAVRMAAQRVRRLDDAQLESAANDLRDTLPADQVPPSALLVEGFALALEALRRSVGVELYDVQIMAALVLAQGSVAEMQTGEGKTLAAAPAAMIAALQGQAVHVVTPNAYLAQRDATLLRPAFQALGLSVGLLPEGNGASPQQKQIQYDCDVTYGTGYEFGFDYLRDQLLARQTGARPLGDTLLARLRGQHQQVASTQRGQRWAIVDEVDNVLIDDASSPLILSDAPLAPAEDADACRAARGLVLDLRANQHFFVTPDGLVELTAEGIERIHGADVVIPLKQLRRPWGEYVQQALRAELLFRRDVHYVVGDDEIRIVDGSTGRIFSDRTWNEGLHQAIEVKEGLPVTNERAAVAQVTRQRYFRLYQWLGGMTGTAVGCEREFRAVYGMSVRRIPQRLPCRREVYPTRAFADAGRKWSAIAGEVRQCHRAGRPVLVGTRTIADSEQLADILQQHGLPFQLLNGRQDAEEAAVVAQAGRRGAITIATNLAGRGTDIRLEDGVADLGGLHVIVAEPHELSRIDRQLSGRGARQGDPGSARTYISAEDSLIQLHGPWLIRPLCRCAREDGEVPIDLSSRIRGIQRTVQRRQAAVRMAMMRRDLARDSLLSQLESVR